MEDTHKETIRRNWTYLLENMMMDELLDDMYAREVLTEGMREEIEVKSTRREKVTQFLFTLQKRGPRAFQKFLDGLRACSMEFIAEQLESTVQTERR